MPTAVIGTSVLSSLPVETTDWPRLRQSILNVFPNYKNRFEGFGKWMQLLGDAGAGGLNERLTAPSPLEMVACPTRLLTCTNFSGMEV